MIDDLLLSNGFEVTSIVLLLLRRLRLKFCQVVFNNEIICQLRMSAVQNYFKTKKHNAMCNKVRLKILLLFVFIMHQPVLLDTTGLTAWIVVIVWTVQVARLWVDRVQMDVNPDGLDHPAMSPTIMVSHINVS